jgi:hypothetical protein
MTPDNWPEAWPQIPAVWEPKMTPRGSVAVKAVATPTSTAGQRLRFACVEIDITSEPDTWRWSDGNRWHYVVGPPTVMSAMDYHQWEWRYGDTVVKVRVPRPDEELGEY